MTSNEYWAEIEGLADTLVEKAMEYCDQDRSAAEKHINYSALFEAIDRHNWLYMTSICMDILQLSDNADYFAQCLGGADEILRDGGIDKLHQVMAFYAMKADVQDRLEAAFDAYARFQRLRRRIKN